MRKYYRTTGIVLAAVLVATNPAVVMASDGIVDDGIVISDEDLLADDGEDDSEETTEEETSEETSSEAAKINYEDVKPYLALGANLSDSQLDTVLSLMGITREDMNNYTVIYITNEMEHQYLDGYIDSSVIGKNALSCVMIKLTGEGTGIKVTTKNINYCTTHMYRNALITAGVENAEVVVAGPMQISGTAALIGAMKAYEEMTGTELDADAQDTAMDELVTIGKVTDGLDEETASKVQSLIDYVKAEVIANDITDLEDIKDIIKEAEEQFGVTLDDSKINLIAELMKKIGKLDIDPTKLLEQAGDLYDKYGETILKDAQELLDSILTEDVKKGFWDTISTFFSSIWEAIKKLFS